MQATQFFHGIQTLDALKIEYKRLARLYHPDVNKDVSATRIMQEINGLYEFLCKTLYRNESGDNFSRETEAAHMAHKERHESRVHEDATMYGIYQCICAEKYRFNS